MKAILISIKPKYVADILNHKKTIEVRKSMPKCDLPIDVYIYCTKDKKSKVFGFADRYPVDFITSDRHRDTGLSGYVVAKFTLNKVEEISYNYRSDFTSVYTDTLDTEDLEKQACLTRNEFAKYLKGNYGYAWHISNLEIFDRPKELSEFRKPYYCHCKLRCEDNLKPSFCREHCQHNLDRERLSVCCDRDGWVKEWNNGTNCLTKAPQSFMFIESEK